MLYQLIILTRNSPKTKKADIHTCPLYVHRRKIPTHTDRQIKKQQVTHAKQLQLRNLTFSEGSGKVLNM